MTQLLEQLRAGELAGAKRLKLTGGLTEFPREIFSLADTLEILDLSGNALSALPDDLPRLHKLRILFCADNGFTRLPDVLGRCASLELLGFKANRIEEAAGNALPPALRWLILTDNRLTALPSAIGNCGSLQKLMLAGNRLTALPPELARCSRLELLRLAANQLTELPDWLTRMPRLSWLAYSGNPMSEASEELARTTTPIAHIHWNSLTLNHQVGEGASGVIYRATLEQDDEPARDVAVKLFKGAVTSDGLPRSEMAACIAGGAHPNMIPVVGKIIGHPSSVDGLVMELIDPGFTSLAGPPSLDSCTRDIYDPETRFTLLSALRIAAGMASAACQLHAKGIMHGDLYAHNMLHGEEGNVLLGDFGAASFYSSDKKSAAGSLEPIEVRAFGCLLEELIERCDMNADSAMQSLVSLKTSCLNEDLDARPRFRRILSALTSLSLNDA